MHGRICVPWPFSSEEKLEIKSMLLKVFEHWASSEHYAAFPHDSSFKQERKRYKTLKDEENLRQLVWLRRDIVKLRHPVAKYAS